MMQFWHTQKNFHWLFLKHKERLPNLNLMLSTFFVKSKIILVTQKLKNLSLGTKENHQIFSWTGKKTINLWKYRMEIRFQFHQRSTSIFCTRRSQKKDTDNLTEFLSFWELCAQMLLVERWWNWPLVLISPTF